MIFVSYAQSGEDVPLWRALKTLPTGFYIDIGALDPDTGSVTRGFYDRGWAGVNVAASPAILARLEAVRVRDVNLAYAPEIAPETTLADICREHVHGPVHFLRVDAANAEPAVLRDMDFAACRPWIILVKTATPEPWGPILLAAAYRFVCCDGLNRFYAADERHDALAPAFTAPFDGTDTIIRDVNSALAGRLAAAEHALDLARAEAALAATRAHGTAERLLDATRSAGALRVVATERADTVIWQRGVVEEARALERRLRAESEWLRSLLEDQRRVTEERTAQLLARTSEAAWLHACLKDSAAALDTVRNDRNVVEQRWHAAEARASQAEAHATAALAYGEAAQARAEAALVHMRLAQQSEATLRASLSWRLTTPLRRASGMVWRARVADPIAETPPLEPAPAVPPPPPMPEPAAQPASLPEPAPPPPAPADPEPEPMPEPERTPPPEPEGVQPEPPLTPEPAPPAHRPVHTVHQFHPDSAVGDAITNAMIALRHILRSMGYESDIFVERRPAELAHEVQLVDALPRHDGYVLLAHHSMGYAGFPDILALPARKVLVYHNITPPEFLHHAKRLQHNAEIGRQQLETWRDHAVAALALSEYNAIELRRLGFDAVRSCTLLFDLGALRRRAAVQAPHDRSVFTILFVGRVTDSKAQDDLIDAYALFRTRYDKPSRLVLVGRFDAEEFGYLDRLNDIILEHGLSERVLMTGLVSDDELDSWYAQADLYVSLSHHEGFGIPLIEAMAHRVPVLAWPAGAISYTLGGASALLAARDPDSVAAHMLALAQDPAEREAMIARQTASLSRFELPHQLPLLQEALALAGAQPRPAATVQASLAANVHLTVTGHVNGTYSLAAVNRTIAAAFEAARPGAARLIPVEGGPTSFLGEVPPEAQALVGRLVARPPAVTGPDVVLSQHYPVYVPEHRGDLTLAMVFWEESLFPPATVQTLNGNFDGVLAPSSFVARLLVESGVAVPVINIGQAPPLTAYTRIAERPARDSFTFLHVSSAFPRKGLDRLLNAWQRAFRATDPVRLVIKTFPNIHHDIAAQIDHVRQADPNAAPITLIEADLSEADHLALFVDADAMVLPTRGEGYNLAAAEAMAAGLPLIVTDSGGHRDFCGPGTARLVRSRPGPSSSHLATPHSLWREPDLDDLTDALRDMVHGAPLAQLGAARAAIEAAIDPAAFVDRLAAAAATLILARPRPPARLAWITTWDVRCGIASYARALIEAMPKDGVARLAILCDDRTPSDGDIVRPCWRLDPAIGTDALVAAVLSEDADVVMVQHQPGLLRWGALTGLLTALVAKGRAVVVTLHNTLHLLEIDAEERAACVTALGSIARILVHTIADLDRLEALGLQPALLPHGAPASAPPRLARDLPPDSDPVVGCYGFFLPGKGIGALIEAVAALRSRWPGIRLRLVNAEYDDPISTTEIAACRAVAETCGLAVEWHVDYLPDADSMALLAGCDLIALPYEASREASSAAVRWALASGVPVAVTPIALFDETGNAVARLPGGDAAALADGLAELLADRDRRIQLGAEAARWLADRAVPDIARRLHGMQLGLAAQRQVGAPFDGAVWTPAG